MNLDFLKPILAQAVRDGLRVCGTWLMTYGVIKDGAGLNAFVGAGMTLAGLVWGWWITTGHVQAATLLKKLTDTKTETAAVAVAKAMPSAAITGAADNAKSAVAAGAQVVGALLIGFLLLAGMDNASAKTVSALVPAAPTDLMSKLEKVQTDVVTGVVADLTAALADASAIDPDTNKARDAIAAACYPEEIKFLQTLPVAQPFQGKYIAVQLFQRKRDFVIQLQKGLPVSLKIGCGALLGDEASILIKTLGMVGVSVALPELAPLLPAAGILPALPFGLSL